MPGKEGLGGGALLAWRALPVVLPLALGVVFLAQVGSLHGPEATYPAVLAAVLVAVSGYNLFREVFRRVPASAKPPSEPPSETSPSEKVPVAAAAGGTTPQAAPRTASSAAPSTTGTGQGTVTGQTSGEDEPAEEPDRLTAGRPLALIALLVLTLALITPLGFFAALPLLVVGSLAITGVRRPVPLIISALGIWTSAYLIFGVVLDVPLPTGMLW